MSDSLLLEDLPQTLRRTRALRGERRYAEAEALLNAAVLWWPDDETLLADRGMLSHEQMRWADMAERFAALRERFPGNLYGHSRGGEALRWLKRFDEAEAVISAAVPRFPASLELLTQWTLVACDRAAWDEVHARAEALIDRLPSNPQSYRIAASAYAKQGRHDLADVAIAEGLHRLGPQQPLVMRFAELATAREDWPRAVRRWSGARQQFPDLVAAHDGLVAALTRAGRDEDAEQALGEAVVRFPKEARLGIEYAKMAERRFALEDARDRWQRLRAAFPNHATIEKGLSSILMNFADGPPAPAPMSPAEQARARAEIMADPKKLLLAFESIGECCEFGLLQRHFDLEPISLLRWAASEYGALLKALDRDFEGLGEPVNTMLSGTNEYVVADARYGFHMHTFVRPHEAERGRFFEGQCKRLRFLLRKFREDAVVAEKILVRATEKPTTHEQIRTLHRALRRYGPVVLLHVTAAPTPEQANTVQWLDPDLMVAHIDRLGRIPRGWDIPFDSWVKICRLAFALRAQS
jgi:tetratricopeptide (TPR) repeat protein